MRRVMSVLGATMWVALLLASARTVEPTTLAAASGSGVGTGQTATGDRINGRKVFLRENCYICHGGRAGGGMCPSLRADKPGLDDVMEVVLQGTSNGMPSFRGRVSTQEIRDLSAYIRSLRTAQEPTFTHWWEPGVPTQ